jgi:hypothetical protein
MNLKNHYLESLAFILAQMQTFAIHNSNKNDILASIQLE